MIKDLFKSIFIYGKAFALVSKLRLWRYLITPIIIAFLLLAIVVLPLWFLYSITKGFLSYWHNETANTVLFELANYTEIIIYFIFGKVLYRHLAMAILSPILSPLSLKIEKELYGDFTHKHIQLSFMKSLWRGVRINARNFIKEIILTWVLLLVALIPGIGILVVILIFILQAYYAGFGNMDTTLERYFNYKDSIKFVKTHRGIAIGNGVVFMFLLFIPFVGLLIAYPISFIAASVITLEYLHLNDDKKINNEE